MPIRPITAIVPRRDVHVGPVYTPALRNVRPVEAIGVQQAPDPIRQGDTPSRPSRMPIVTFLNIAGIRSVMADGNMIRGRDWIAQQGAQVLGVGQPYGHMAPVNARTNTVKTPAEAYGSLVSIYPANPQGY